MTWFDWARSTSFELLLVVAVLALGLSVMGKRLTPRWHHALWWIVLLRLWGVPQFELPAFGFDPSLLTGWGNRGSESDDESPRARVAGESEGAGERVMSPVNGLAANSSSSAADRAFDAGASSPLHPGQGRVQDRVAANSNDPPISHLGDVEVRAGTVESPGQDGSAPRADQATGGPGKPDPQRADRLAAPSLTTDVQPDALGEVEERESSWQNESAQLASRESQKGGAPGDSASGADGAVPGPSEELTVQHPPMPTRGDSKRALTGGLARRRAGDPAPLAVGATGAQAASSLSPEIDSRGSTAERGAIDVAFTWLLRNLFSLWLVGVALVLAINLVQEWRFRRRVATSRPLTDPDVLAVLEDARASLGVRRPVRLRELDQLGSPALYGLIHPTILLPVDLTRTLSPDQLRCVFLHELAHLRHGDLGFNFVLVLTRAVHWWNPVAWVALHRLLDSREQLRDWQALQAVSTSPRSYAQTLVHVLEHHSLTPPPVGALTLVATASDVRRRLEMITRFGLTSWKGTTFGMGCAAVLAWSALTAPARTSEPVTAPNEPDVEQSVERIRVVRQAEEPAWRTELKGLLQTPLMQPENCSFEEFVSYLRESLGINVVVYPEAFMHADGCSIGFEIFGGGQRPAAELLRFACYECDLDMSLSQGALVLSVEGDTVPGSTDVRLFNVSPIVDRGGDEDELMDVIFSLVDCESWDWAGRRLSYFEGSFCITQKPEVQEKVEELLNTLLARGGRLGAAREDAEVWRKLETVRMDVRFQESPIEELLQFLSSQTDVRFAADEEIWVEEPTIDLQLADVTLGDVAQWVSLLTGASWHVQDGVAMLTYELPPRVRIYEVRDLVEYADSDELETLIRDTCSPDSWDTFEYVDLRIFDDLLIVQQSDPVLDQVAQFLATLRQARS